MQAKCGRQAYNKAFKWTVENGEVEPNRARKNPLEYKTDKIATNSVYFKFIYLFIYLFSNFINFFAATLVNGIT